MTCFPNSITIPTSTLGFVQFLVFTHVVGIKWVSYFSCGFLTLLVRFISHFRFPLCEMPPFLLWCFCLNYWHPLYILDLNPLQLHVLIFFFFFLMPMASLLAQMVKNLPVMQEGDLGLIPGSGSCPGEGNGNPHQCSCLENPMDRGAWQAIVPGVTKSRTRLSD